LKRNKRCKNKRDNMINSKNKELMIKAIIIIAAFLVYFSWSLSQPFNSGPDEFMKYDICKYIVNHNSLPQGGDEEVRNPIWGISYGFMPILAYIVSAIFMKIAMLFTQNNFTILVAARFASVLFNTITVIMVIKIAEKLFKGIYRWLFICMIAFLPQFAFLGTYINCDSLAIASISIIVYAWILGIENKWDIKSCILLAVGIGICALSYYNAYGYILFSIVFFITTLWYQKHSVKEIIKKGLIISLISLAIAGWWFVRNAIIYDGDFLGLTTENEYSEKYAMDEFKPSKRETPQNGGMSLLYMLFNYGWLENTFCSFIGMFGAMNIGIPHIIYIGYMLLFVIAFVGFILKIKELFWYDKKDDEKKPRIFLNYCFIGVIITPIILSVYYSYTGDYQPQGRYIMPMLIPFMYFIVYGIHNIMKKLIKNEKLEKIMIIGLTLILVLICIYCLTGVVIPFHKK